MLKPRESRSTSDDTIYWAAKSRDDIANEILTKKDNFYRFLITTNRLALYRKCWDFYYSSRLNVGELEAGGEQGELTTIYINQFRNLLAHLESMTVQQRIAFEPKATNSDVKSMAQVILSKSILEYYMREKKLEKNIVSAVKQALIYGEAFVRIDWETQAGEVHGLNEDGSPQFQGDIQYTNYSPDNVIRDYTLNDPSKCQYFILRDFKNKFDLIAKYPELKEDILACATDSIETIRTSTVNYVNLKDSDLIPVYTLVHARTASLPEGRYVQCLENGAILLDGALPYQEPHVYRMAPDEEDGSIFGMSVSYDLLPIQEALTTLYSTALTNQSSFGVQNILTAIGSGVNPSQLQGGLNNIEWDHNFPKPEPLNLTQTPAEIFNFMGMLEKIGETISGVNSVARGNPEASLESGAALALIQSMAIQFNQNLQRNFIQLVEDIGSGTINMIREFASTPRVVTICGKSKLPLMKYFTGEDVSNISRVLVDVGSPLMRTTAGKIQIAETFIQNGFIKSPEQYLQVVNTGILDPLIEGEQSELLLIADENESLSSEKPVRVIATDNHKLHIQEHKTVLANTNIRLDPNNPIVVNALNHIREHLDYMSDPEVQRMQAALNGQPVAPPNAGNSVAPPLDQAAQAAPGPQPNLPNQPQPPQNTDPRSAAVIQEQAAQNVPIPQ